MHVVVQGKVVITLGSLASTIAAQIGKMPQKGYTVNLHPCPTLPLQKLHNLTVEKLTQQARAWVSVL
jgi:hypothetical protein